MAVATLQVMSILSFLAGLMGSVMLLLYAVRMVRTGIERAFGSSFSRLLTRTRGAFPSAASGIGLAVLLQSSAAVALLAAGFAGSGIMSFHSGLATVLGADLGSALLVQILSFPVDWLVPVLLALGGGFFIRSTGRSLKQAGRIILGIAFILISLRFLRETVEPIRQSAFLPAIADYLGQDYISAFLVGAGLAFIMHSSVAVILMCVTLTAIGALSVEAGISLVLGANLGSAMIPVWLSRAMLPPSRRITSANATIRGAGAVLAVVTVNNLPLIGYLQSASQAQTLINTHLAFNGLLLLAVPFVGMLEAPFSLLLPDLREADREDIIEHRSVLGNPTGQSPQIILSSLKREVLRMVQLVESMVVPVMDIYRTGNKEQAEAIIAEDQHVNNALDGIRRYMIKLPADNLQEQERLLAQELAEYAILVEAAGDIVVKRLVPRAMQKRENKVQFSREGDAELCWIHDNVLANLRLAANVLVSDDPESARLLLEAKAEMNDMERKSRIKHLKRLNEGAVVSLESSNIHLETLRAFKEMNSQIASVAYPILHRNGQLLGSRLIDAAAEG